MIGWELGIRKKTLRCGKGVSIVTARTELVTVKWQV